MLKEKPFVLSIAGFDPSGGAGILADIKTFESIGVYGIGVCTAITFQNENTFKEVNWLSVEQILSQIDILFEKYSVDIAKIGLVKDMETLLAIIKHLKAHNSSIKLIWDPILKASAGFEFHTEIDRRHLDMILKRIYLITPNIPEAEKLNVDAKSLECACLIKGGHHSDNASDILYNKGLVHIIEGERIPLVSKHGSGCVLSSAIAAWLAKGFTLEEACKKAKHYTLSFLKSSESLLGYHSFIKQDSYA